MVQHYRYGDPAAAQPEAGIDGSRVIAFFIFNTGVHVHVYPGDSEDVSDPAVQERLDTALEAFRAACCRYEHLFLAHPARFRHFARPCCGARGGAGGA